MSQIVLLFQSALLKNQIHVSLSIQLFAYMKIQNDLDFGSYRDKNRDLLGLIEVGWESGAQGSAEL